MAPKKVPLTPRKSSTKKTTLTPKLEGVPLRLSQSPIVLVELPPVKPNPVVFIDIKIGGEDIGRLLVEVFMHITPKAAENFHCLCTGEKGMGKQGKNLTYRKSIFFRVIPGAYAQGGDIIKNNGIGGESIYDGKPFEDENFQKSNSVVGSLAMCNRGPNSNDSQFFINLAPNPDLDGKHVVFGQVKEESVHILKAIEAAGSWTGRTHQTVSVRRCGWANKPSKKLL
jgi:peptidylprolyl isomerase